MNTATKCTKSCSDINYKDFIKIYKKCTAKPYSLNDATLTSDNTLRFRKNIFNI